MHTVRPSPCSLCSAANDPFDPSVGLLQGKRMSHTCLLLCVCVHADKAPSQGQPAAGLQQRAVLREPGPAGAAAPRHAATHDWGVPQHQQQCDSCCALVHVYALRLYTCMVRNPTGCACDVLFIRGCLLSCLIVWFALLTWTPSMPRTLMLGQMAFRLAAGAFYSECRAGWLLTFQGRSCIVAVL
jgi:hypothetical protein